MLGINIEAVESNSFEQASGGMLESYAHMVNIEFLGIILESIVYFAKYLGIAGISSAGMVG